MHTLLKLHPSQAINMTVPYIVFIRRANSGCDEVGDTRCTMLMARTKLKYNILLKIACVIYDTMKYL